MYTLSKIKRMLTIAPSGRLKRKILSEFEARRTYSRLKKEYRSFIAANKSAEPLTRGGGGMTI